MLAIVRRFYHVSLLALLVATVPPSTALATGDPAPIVDFPLAGPPHGAGGSWRTKIQQVFDSRTRALSRRLYEVWDPEPSRDLDFAWTPDRPESDRPGRINGSGQLVWRLKGLPSYDPDGVLSEYHGTVRAGRVDGRGTYLDQTGLLYEGEWRDGLMHGRGTLKLASGDEYIGEFRRGKANGVGRHIDITGEIFEGPFVDGRRHGRGTTILPSGTRYASIWVAGTERSDSVSVRIAQAQAQGLPNATNDIRIGMNVDRRVGASPIKGVPRPKRWELLYTSSNTTSGFEIKPDDPRLLAMWKGGAEIQLTQDEEEAPGGGAQSVGKFRGVFSFVRQQLAQLRLNLEVQNRSSTSVGIAGAFLEVAYSRSELKPAIQLSMGIQGRCSHGYFQSHFALENFGWATAERARIRFAFASPQSRSRPAAYPLHQEVGNIMRVQKVDLLPHFTAQKVDFAALARYGKNGGFHCKSKEQAACLLELQRSGSFGALAPLLTLQGTNVMVNAAGILEYTWKDQHGKMHQSSSPFNASFVISQLKNEAECGEGGQPELLAIKPIKLRLEAERYRIPIAFQSSIPAARTAQLRVALEAEKSSEHVFSVVLQLSDGREVRSMPARLLYFRPSWVEEAAR